MLSVIGIVALVAVCKKQNKWPLASFSFVCCVCIYDISFYARREVDDNKNQVSPIHLCYLGLGSLFVSLLAFLIGSYSQIVECHALPTLILLLRSEETN